MIKTVFKVIGLTLLVGYLLAAGILYGCWRPEPRYKGIHISIDYPSDEAHFVSEASIRQLVTNKPGFRCKGQPFSAVNTLELTQYLEEHNRLIRHVACYHTPDSLLRIDIEQRDPIIRVKSQNDVRDAQGHAMRDFYIDRDGEMMPAQLGTAIRLPLVTGHVRASDLQPLHDFALYLKHHDFWADDITQIYLDEKGDVSLIPRIGDHLIELGSLDGYDEKLDHVREFYDQVMPRRGWNAYHVISVKYDGQVVGRK